MRKRQEAERKKYGKRSAIAIILNSSVCPFKYNGIFMCMYCKNQFAEMPDLVQHTTKEHDNVTEKDIKHAVNGVPVTIPIKINITDIKCRLCDNEPRDFNELKHHLIAKHKIRIDSKDDGVMAYSITSDACVCVRCGSKFESYRKLTEHMTYKHRNTLICEKCGSGFPTKTALHNHAASHAPSSFSCEICGKVYRNSLNKRKHVKVVHHNAKTNKCIYCSEQFKHYYQKLKHINMVHAKKRYYKFRFCIKSFSGPSNLKIHEQSAHSGGDKMFICDNCNYSTHFKPCLMRHMIRHMGIKQFTCDVCGKSFARKSTLSEHLRIHNNDRRFACQHCDKAFVQISGLNSHMRTHHKETESEDD
jgi:PR domain zinc finger protein 5